MSTVITNTLTGKTFRLGRFEFLRPVILAPMSGVTDLPFRRIAAGFGADMVVTEMVAAESFGKGDAEMCLRTAGLGMAPHMVQLAGREPYWMAEAARMAEANGADIIDINMGCPARRVTTGWSGAALMRDLDHAMTLVEATVAAVKVPVTLKMRLGWDRATINAPELARRAEGAGVQMITVHGRTRDQFYEGRADWAAIRRVREAVSLPLIANGDVSGFEDADTILRESGADGVMIGRGACGRPWLPAAVARYLACGQRWPGPDGEVLVDLVVAHHAALVEHYGPVKGLLAARKHLGWYLDALAARLGRVREVDASTDVARARRELLSAVDILTIPSLIRSTLRLVHDAHRCGSSSNSRRSTTESDRVEFSPGRAA
jgi:nifR3 family TIM-barrel protein